LAEKGIRKNHRLGIGLEMPVEEAGDPAEGLLRLRHAGIEELARGSGL
jgi:hypothetical protein